MTTAEPEGFFESKFRRMRENQEAQAAKQARREDLETERRRHDDAQYAKDVQTAHDAFAPVMDEMLAAAKRTGVSGFDLRRGAPVTGLSRTVPCRRYGMYRGQLHIADVQIGHPTRNDYVLQITTPINLKQQLAQQAPEPVTLAATELSDIDRFKDRVRQGLWAHCSFFEGTSGA